MTHNSKGSTPSAALTLCYTRRTENSKLTIGQRLTDKQYEQRKKESQTMAYWQQENEKSILGEAPPDDQPLTQENDLPWDINFLVQRDYGQGRSIEDRANSDRHGGLRRRRPRS
ncbi:hypothetical protein R1sor_002951 [Riccia sorocarpa]|uniref:Uncharacterized protein n=1 Tax=Riccia sorocarpa TaxID=122646 RepID=A0ABD3H2Z9_9MARC